MNNATKQQLLREAHYELCRRDFWEFCLYMDNNFFTERAEILRPLAHEMQRLVKPLPPQTELDILNISLPPRTGKSYLATLFSAWCIGHYPKESIMRNSVTGQLYMKFSGDLIDIMTGQSHRDRYSNIFQVEFSTQSVTGWKLANAKQGVTYFGGGVGGTIIGMGASLLSILDDSVKNEEEALSENALDKKWGWYTSTMDSRQEKGVKRLFIGTRWSKHDIVGRLMDNGIFDKKTAKSVEVPALIDGKSFCENIHSTQSLKEKKKLLSDILWEAEWQQKPIEAKGLVFPKLNRFSKDEYFRENGTPLFEPDGILVVGDIADEGSDSLCVPVGYLLNGKVFIPDVLFTKDPIEVTQPLTASFILKHKPQRVQFESNNGGKGYALEVKRLVREKTSRIPIKWKHTSSNKHTRILMGSGKIKEDFYFLEEDDYEMGSDYYRFVEEIKRYNKLGKVKHDDGPDGVTMLSEYLDKLMGTITFLK